MCDLPVDPEPEGCVDIFVDQRVLPDSDSWGDLAYGVARHPFWRDESGLHVAWVTYQRASEQPYLVVASFDAATGAAQEVRAHDVFLPGNSPAVASWDAAGSPTGDFAFALTHRETTYGPSVDKVVIGNVGEPDVRAVWKPPFPVTDAGLFGVGWDGEAFVAHFLEQSTPDVRLVRLDTEGSELGAPTYVGKMSSVWAEYSDWATDRESGRSWIVSTLTGGVWVSGHERDGTLLPGTEAEGGVKVTGEGAPPIYLEGWYPAVGTAGSSAMVGWNGHDPSEPEYESRFQVLDGVTPNGAAARLFSTPNWGTLGPRAFARVSSGWWAAIATSCGIESMTVAVDGGVERRILVPNIPPECHPFCEGETPYFPSFMQLSAITWGDELWLGFWDWSNNGVGPTMPYRIVRVKEGCRYRTAYDVEGPGSR